MDLHTLGLRSHDPSSWELSNQIAMACRKGSHSIIRLKPYKKGTSEQSAFRKQKDWPHATSLTADTNPTKFGSEDDP
jgi:hypothetical protein